ncbi:hypothetical protein CHU98_g11407 [Xylaria longipes]|nr:hypothetical protein CHU98_g11407 [Xylaria longipes]
MNLAMKGRAIKGTESQRPQPTPELITAPKRSNDSCDNKLLPTSGIFSHRSNTASFAYLDLECVGSERDKLIGLSMSKKLDGPAWRVRRKQQRQLQPSNEAEDPYVTAVLTALTQGLQHQKQSVNGLNECLESMPTKLDPTALPRQTAKISGPPTGRPLTGHFTYKNTTIE